MSILNLEGAHENELAATGEFNAMAPRTALMLPNGHRVVLPTEVLLAAMGGSVGVRPVDGAETVAAVAGVGREAEEEAVIPLVAEQLEVSKRTVETGRVRLRRETEEHVERVSVPLTTVTWEVEHVPVNTPVEAAPEVRQVGETLIFSLVEERMVVKRELWLREEVHVRKVTSVVEKSAEFPVKRDVLREERTGVTE